MIFAAFNKFDRKKAFGAPSMKFPNNVKQFINRPAASRHVMHGMTMQWCFFPGIIIIRGFTS